MRDMPSQNVSRGFCAARTAERETQQCIHGSIAGFAKHRKGHRAKRNEGT
jgi:hypothetical protein